MNIKLISKNPTAYHNYNIENKIETGIVLSGTEIKSIRAGKVNLKDSYAYIKNDSIYNLLKYEILDTKLLPLLCFYMQGLFL